jgi:cyclic beta-1,2-glucan synthetase
MYRAGVEGILGIRREGGFLTVDPRLPSTWPGFEATVTVASTRCEIRVETSSTAPEALLDGISIPWSEAGIRVPLEGGTRRLLIRCMPGRFVEKPAEDLGGGLGAPR